MEYLPTTLRRCLDTHGALPTEISCGIILEVAIGLRYLHEFSPPIIHRDLSSNNVLLTTNMTAKISDLGVAKILDMSPSRAARMTQTQAPGTPTFMPPEAMLARPKYTSKVDIFSLGVLMVHILSGEWPMPSEAFAEDPLNPNSVVSVTEFERRREFMDKISADHPLLGLIEQCLSNVASHRPDAAEVVHQLQVEHARVPPRLVNQLEILKHNQSLRAELQQCSRENNDALRRDNEAVRRENCKLQKENEGQRKEIEAMRTKKDVNLTVREHLIEELHAMNRASNLLQSSLEIQQYVLQRKLEGLRILLKVIHQEA